MADLRGSADIQTLLRDLAAAPGRLAEIVGEADDQRLAAAQPGEWSARTVMAHLRDDEFMVMRLRIARMLVEDVPELAPFDEKAWAASRYTGRDARDELISDFRTQRTASVEILRRLGPEELRRGGSQPEYGSFDIHWWLQHWVSHDNNHLDQISRALASA